TVEQEIPSCAFINIVKHVKSPRKTVKDDDTCSQNPKVDKRDWNGLMSKRLGLGYGYTKKACFVCGSFSHLNRDCDFHEKIMAKQVELNISKNKDNPHQTLKGKGIVESGCSRHMTRNKAYLVKYQDFNGGPVAFGGSKGQITGKGKIKTGKLDFEYVYFVKELQHFNLFSVSHMCDKKNKLVTAKNKANNIAGPKEVNNSAVKNGNQKLNGDTGSKTNKELVDQDDQTFLEGLERLKQQAKEADDAAETLEKTFAQGTEDLLLQAGAASASSTNYVNTASTLVNTASTPINTACPLRNVSAAKPSYPDLSTYANQDDS
nr:ribonuclease H-like domain-containing protein [Tanacetum cinerariifolium]